MERAAILSSSHQNPLEWVASLFQQHGWKILERGDPALRSPDLVLSKGRLRYVAELKTTSESRRDRVLPMLSQAILIARTQAMGFPNAQPLAIVVTNHVSNATLNAFQAFHQEFAPETAVGLIDRDGFCWFAGSGLEDLNANQPPRKNEIIRPVAPASLFSDLNQWLLKILLAPEIPPEQMTAPRLSYRNATQLAEAAKVSVMTATRFVKQLQEEGFLDTGSENYRLVRRSYLFDRWQASYVNAPSEVPARWILSSQDRIPFPEALRSALRKAPPYGKRNPRICLGLFSAADELGSGFVHGAPPHLLMDCIEPKFLFDLGISIVPKAGAHEIFLRVPPAPEAVFRAAVQRDGLWISDILQTWLDVSSHPRRGKNQADEIRRRHLKSIFQEL